MAKQIIIQFKYFFFLVVWVLNQRMYYHVPKINLQNYAQILEAKCQQNSVNALQKTAKTKQMSQLSLHPVFFSAKLTQFNLLRNCTCISISDLIALPSAHFNFSLALARVNKKNNKFSVFFLYTPIS